MTTDWSSTKIESTLASFIDSVVEELFVYGSRKYTSRAEFIKAACLDLLRKEGVTESGSLDTGNKAKKGKLLAKEMPA